MDQEVKDKIFELWQQGISGGDIAVAVGVTRNSVMGFIHRMREKGHTMRSERTLKVKVKEIKIKEPKPIKEKKVKKVREEPVFIEEPEVIDTPYEGPTNLDGLRHYSCRFIVENGNYETTKYCNKRISRQSYCEEHYALCYFPARMQERELLKRIS